MYGSKFYTLVDFGWSKDNSVYVKAQYTSLEDTPAADYDITELGDTYSYRFKYNVFYESIDDTLVTTSHFPYDIDFKITGEWIKLPMEISDSTFLCKGRSPRKFILQLESYNSTQRPHNVTFSIDPCMFSTAVANNFIAWC